MQINTSIHFGKYMPCIGHDTPMFFAFKHFTYYVQPGAHYVNIGEGADGIAFLNPDGNLVIELRNPSEKPAL